MVNIIIEKIEKSIEEKFIEIVERKGIGHPDTICDSCCEAASQALSQYYLKNFAKVFHHNLDKGLLVAGKSERKFKGGRIIKKINLIIAGRATDLIYNKKIPVEEICKRAVSKWLQDNLEMTKEQVDNLFNISINYESGSTELISSEESSKANDTSFGVSHAPFSKTEKLVLEIANLINSRKFKKEFPFVGKDLKIMALRQGNSVKLIIALAFVDKYISSLEEYFKKKEKLKENLIKKFSDFPYNLEIIINALENTQAKSEQELYLTVTGLSAEQGDDGQVGRGNRINGLITPCREMSLEAAAGKNIEHPGKLYQILSYIISNEIFKIKGVRECEIKILSKIGSNLDNPEIVNIELLGEANEEQIKSVVNKIFSNLKNIKRDIVYGKYAIC